MRKRSIKENGKFIVSLYDRTLIWPKPFVDAGYGLLPWDLAHEGNLLDNSGGLGDLINEIIIAVEAGYEPIGLLAAPPCTRWTVSSNRHRAESRIKIVNADPSADDDFPWLMTEMEMYRALGDCVEIIRGVMEDHRKKPLDFYALENPVGIIESEIPFIKEYPVKWGFHPWEFGDPYTKKTFLWGDFEIPTEKTPSLFIIPEYIHNMPPGPDRAAKRSATPKGFAQAFYRAQLNRLRAAA